MLNRKNSQNSRKPATTGSAIAGSGAPSLNQLKISYVAPGKLRCSPNNPRQHSNKQLQQIAKSIERFGFVNPVLIADDFQIIAGHGRVEAAKLLGLKEVPTVRLSNLSAAERRAYVIADNRLAELAGWDREFLASELQGLIELQFDDLELTGFSLPEVELILEADQAAEQRHEQLPANNDRAVSRAGEVWIVGPHRLLCGGADLVHCDVMVRRWQRYTGKAARLEGSDQIFNDVEAARRSEQSAATVSAA